MKKLSLYIFLVLMVCNVGVANPIMLNCEPQDKKNKPLSFILDDKNRDVVFEGKEYLYKNRHNNGLMYSEYKIVFIDNFLKFMVELDRITGALKYSDHRKWKNSYYRCKKVNKTAF